MLCLAICAGIPLTVCGIPIRSEMVVCAHLMKASVRDILLSFRSRASQLLEDAADAGSCGAADVSK